MAKEVAKLGREPPTTSGQRVPVPSGHRLAELTESIKKLEAEVSEIDKATAEATQKKLLKVL